MPQHKTDFAAVGFGPPGLGDKPANISETESGKKCSRELVRWWGYPDVCSDSDTGREDTRQRKRAKNMSLIVLVFLNNL